MLAVRRIIVGAPNAQTSQQDVYRGGAVYRCHVERQHCEPIPFDVQGEPVLTCPLMSNCQTSKVNGGVLSVRLIVVCHLWRIWNSFVVPQDSTAVRIEHALVKEIFGVLCERVPVPLWHFNFILLLRLSCPERLKPTPHSLLWIPLFIPFPVLGLGSQPPLPSCIVWLCCCRLIGKVYDP